MSAQAESSPPFARPMSVVDLADVLTIEKQAYDFPWSHGVFKDCLRIGYSCWVLAEGQGIHGYGIMSVAAGEAHILNLCVRPRRQRQGLGARMLRQLCRVACELRATTVLLEVRPSNGVAVRLYERHGFERIGKRRDYYPHLNGREDAFVYALECREAPWLKASG